MKFDPQTHKFLTYNIPIAFQIRTKKILYKCQGLQDIAIYQPDKKGFVKVSKLSSGNFFRTYLLHLVWQLSEVGQFLQKGGHTIVLIRVSEPAPKAQNIVDS